MVSVIITTYKREPLYLTRAIESVVRQTYTDWELIVVDDSPASYALREQAREAVEQFAARRANIVYVPQAVNGGACKARNRGLSMARGEYIALLDDDDEWVENKLEAQLAAFAGAAEDVAIVYNDYYQQDDDTGKRKTVSLPGHEGDVFARLLESNFIGSCSFPMLRASALADIGGFDESLPSCQDWDVWLRLARKYKVRYIAEPLVVYHAFHGESISGKAANKVRGFEAILEKNRESITKDRELYWRHLIRLAPMYGWNGQVGKALGAWGRAVALQPLRVRENVFFLAGRVLRQLYRRTVGARGPRKQ